MLGAVLTGGASTRMGRDKAFVRVDGVAMADRVAAALRAAGARPVVRVGGASGDVADAYPGEGPLGGIITALALAPPDDNIVVTAPCDMPWITPAQITALRGALEADDAVDVAHARGQHLVAVWRAARALPVLQRCFDAQERAPKRALLRLAAVAVDLPGGRWSTDVDSPDDLV